MDRSVELLPGEERIGYYRAHARQAMEYAQSGPSDEHRAAWLGIAANWAALADEVERQERRKAATSALSAA